MSDLMGELDKNGCAWGHEESLKVAQRVTDRIFEESRRANDELEDRINRRYDSKYESAEAVSNICLGLARDNKEELLKLRNIAVDAVTCTHEAQNSVVENQKENQQFKVDIEKSLREDRTKAFWQLLLAGGLGSGLSTTVLLAVTKHLLK